MTKHTHTQIDSGAASPSITMTDIESFCSIHGKFCLLDWLIEHNFLDYAHYETWRYGSVPELENLVALDKKILRELCNQARALCEQLRLVTQNKDYFRWGEHSQQRLIISKDAMYQLLIGQEWMRSKDLPQMDLFMDNSATISENAIFSALAARDFNAAQKNLDRLTSLNPGHKKLGAYQDLIHYGQHMLQTPLIDAAQIEAELAGLENEVLPLAQELLASGARDYLAFAWRRLSQSLAGRAFDPAQAKLHSTYALMQIPDWQATLNLLSEESRVFDEPVLLQRLAQGYEHLRLRGEVLLCWCHLMELDAEYAEQQITQQNSRLIKPFWDAYWDHSDSLSSAYFGPYLLAREPGIVHKAADFPAFKSAANQAMLFAVNTRLKKQDETEARKRLQKVSPALLRLFMNTMVR